MNLDMDLERDDAAAFGPASVTAGALLPYEGRTLMLGPDGLPSAVFDAEDDGWIAPSNPILVRGQARILPLAWRGEAGGAGVSTEEIAAFASQVQSAAMYWAGNWRVLDDLRGHRGDSIGSYTAALHAAGAQRVNFWTYSETVGLALVWAGVEQEGTMSLAMHVVPAGWVTERRAGKAVRGIDVNWSWDEVVNLYAARTGIGPDAAGADADAAGSLAAEEEERDA
ncbi:MULTISPECIES: hypothetical protein [Microbacterium]|uniref:hypothetical protein n=1 Tax=Microbacterium TaxID=33882 RepID=UPI00217EEB91|nr:MULTISPECIES: hypothetical protein [Microbacterium]UWF77729.1 hypothetical protein JSY13_01205 [Microbacterium neungamense]WCM55899.1 hypothetical protein JRG78_01215 [Microbacterium sp. EF45047]